MLISVIITTKNEEKHISRCLESVKEQSYSQDKIEIIVVDNNSIDNTKEIAKQYTNKIYDYGPERSAQRNLGAREAKGKYILYLDADMILSNDVISECISMCEDQGILALYIPEKIIGKNFWRPIRNFERSFYNASCIDAVRFIRKDKFLEIGGFDEKLNGPEDWDFDRRIKDIGKIGIIKSPLYHNEESFSLKEYWRKKSYYVKNFSGYVEKWGWNDKIIKKQLGFWYRYFGIFLEQGKWKKLIRHPFLTFKMYFLRIIVGVLYLKEIGAAWQSKISLHRKKFL